MLCAGLYTQAQYIHNEVWPGSGGQHQYVADIHYEATADEYRTLHKTSEGIAIFHYDGVGGSIDEWELSRNGDLLDPIRVILDANGNTNVLFHFMVGSDNRFAVVQYNGGTINWEYGISNTAGTINCLPTDMDIDASGNLYITGIYSTLNSDDIFVTTFANNGTYGGSVFYRKDSRDEHPYNISCYASNQIYVGATSIDPTNSSDITAIALEIDNSMGINYQTEFSYTSYNNCDLNQIISTTVRRLGSDIYVFSPSYDDPDVPSPGCLSWFQLDGTFAVTDYRFYDPEFVHYQPKFEFTANGDILSISGIEVDGSNKKYYATYNTSTSGLFNQGGFRYIYSVHDPSARHTFRTAWNSTSNDLFGVMDYYTDPTRFHTVFTNSYGEIGDECTEVLDHNLCDCEYNQGDPELLEYTLLMTQPDPNLDLDDRQENESLVCDDFPQFRSQLISKNETGNTLFPNPATAYADIDYNQTLSKIEVLDISGQTLFVVNPNDKRYRLDVSGFETGTYFVRMTTENGKKIMRKLIKQ